MSAPRVRCPTCKREVPFTPESEFRPFCSDRCRLVDLGAWFAEERSIPDESPGSADDSMDDAAPRPPTRN